MKRIWLFFACAFFSISLSFLVCVFVVSPDWRRMPYYWWTILTWESKKEDCQQIGNKIIIALEQFHNDNGVYPDALSALCPHYLMSIPKHVVGDQQWTYDRYIDVEGDCFTLVLYPIIGVSIPSYEYYSISKKWEVVEF